MTETKIIQISVERCAANPLIDFDSDPSLGDNINGPSVIKVPDWIDKPLGAYYMYFAHHGGQHIRLAYADAPQGPWTVYAPGTLQFDQVPQARGHIASPDVHIDDEHQRIQMYFHCPRHDRLESQWTMFADSSDGIHFDAGTEILGRSYFRVFQWNDWYYAIDVAGIINRSRYPDYGWEERGERLFKPQPDLDGDGTDLPRIRHNAVFIEGETLFVFYTMKAEAPERIYLSTLQLSDDWNDWQCSPPQEVLRPELPYEGTDYPLESSKKGSATQVQQLRDPCIYRENGRTYLYYSIAGEMGIAMAELSIS